MALKDRITNKLNEWKADIEHLNVQMHLGAEEAKEEFEEQKSRLKKWLDSTKHELDELKDAGKAEFSDLRTRMDELRVQAALGRAESKEKLEEQSKKISKGMNALSNEIKELVHENKEDLAELREEAEVKINTMHTQFDMLKLRMKLGSMEAKEDWDEMKDKVGHAFKDAKHKISDTAEASEDKFKAIRSELSSSWKKIRDILKD